MINYNSYLGMAESDYLFAKSSLNNCKKIGIYNSVAAIFSQSAEKYLKAVIDACFVEDEDSIRFLRTHNLRTILSKIKTKYPKISVDVMECKWLGDFYFDARYPGDDFVEVTEEDAYKCLEIVTTIRTAVTDLLADRERQRQKTAEKWLEFERYD